MSTTTHHTQGELAAMVAASRAEVLLGSFVTDPETIARVACLAGAPRARAVEAVAADA